MGKSLNGKELGKGISQRKDGKYQANFTNRFGKRQFLYADTVTEISKKLRDAQYEDARHINVITTNLTLDEWYDLWIENHKQHCRDTTLRSYATVYNRLRADLGWRKVTSLNLTILQNAFNKLDTDNKREDCKSVLVDMLNFAIKDNLLLENIAYDINTVAQSPEFSEDDEDMEERRVLSKEEVSILLDMSKGRQLYPFFVLGLNTGMRMGEMLGLTWDCVDFEKGLITVKKTLAYLPNNGVAIYEFHPPKSPSGKRVIPMTIEVRDVLLELLEKKNRIAVRHNPRVGMENLVFVSKTNNPINEANIRGAIRYLIEQINREYPKLEFEPFTPHSLRHTFATRAIANGMRPKSLQKLLGHKSLKMTMDLYCHVEEESLWEQMSLMGDMVFTSECSKSVV